MLLLSIVFVSKRYNIIVNKKYDIVIINKRYDIIVNKRHNIIINNKRYNITINNNRLAKVIPLDFTFFRLAKVLPLKHLILWRYDFLKHFLRSEYEKNVLAKELAKAFITDNLRGYEIKPVAGDGMCILHYFVEGLQRIGNKVTLSDSKSS